MEVITLNSVLLPAPLGPTTPIMQPGPALKDTLSKTMTPLRSTVSSSAAMGAGAEVGVAMLLQCLHDGCGVMPHQVEVRTGLRARIT